MIKEYIGDMFHNSGFYEEIDFWKLQSTIQSGSLVDHMVSCLGVHGYVIGHPNSLFRAIFTTKLGGLCKMNLN